MPTNNEALLPTYKTLVYALSLPLSILIVTNNSFLLAVLYKKPKLCGISSTATINLSGTAVAIGLVEFVFCLILSGDSWRYSSPTVAVIKYVLIAIPHLAFSLILAFTCFQRFVYKSQHLKQIKPRKTCVAILTFWFVAIILIAVPLAHYDSTQLQGKEGGRVVFLYGKVLIALGLANSKITYVTVLAIVCLLNAAILLGVAYVDGLLPVKKGGKTKATLAPTKPTPDQNKVAPSGSQPEPTQNGNGSLGRSSMKVEDRVAQPKSSESNVEVEDSQNSRNLETSSVKMTKTLVGIYVLYYGLCAPYFLIVVLILFGVPDHSRTGQAMAICEILAYYAFISTFALYPLVFIATLKSVRSYLWKLIC